MLSTNDAHKTPIDKAKYLVNDFVLPSIRTGDDNIPSEPENKYVPIYILTGIFGFIFIFGPLLVPKGPNRGITRWCISLTAFCMWIFWVTIYIAQMNPLMGPRLHNTTIVWFAHVYGEKEQGSLSLENETPFAEPNRDAVPEVKIDNTEEPGLYRKVDEHGNVVRSRRTDGYSHKETNFNDISADIKFGRKERNKTTKKAEVIGRGQMFEKYV